MLASITRGGSTAMLPVIQQFDCVCTVIEMCPPAPSRQWSIGSNA